MMRNTFGSPQTFPRWGITHALKKTCDDDAALNFSTIAIDVRNLHIPACHKFLIKTTKLTFIRAAVHDMDEKYKLCSSNNYIIIHYHASCRVD